MATLSVANGLTRLQFVYSGKRHTIRLGRLDHSQSHDVKRCVEKLITAKVSRVTLDVANRYAVFALPNQTLGVLKRAGLIPDVPQTKLADFLSYVFDQSTVSDSTMAIWCRSRKNMLDFFGADCDIACISANDADGFRKSLQSSLSETTAARRCNHARQFFAIAVAKRWIDENPFASVTIHVSATHERHFFVSQESTRLLMATAYDDEWRLLIALCRWGALRCPSEHMKLTWGDIDLERRTMRVTSPKNIHHANHTRIVPIFPELADLLESLYSSTDSDYVIPNHRGESSFMHSAVRRFLCLAGIEAWPRLFHNMRSTRETELLESFPLHVVCRWLGHSQTVARRHYLQVTDMHFIQATRKSNVAHQTEARREDSDYSTRQLDNDDHCQQVLADVRDDQF